MDNKEFNELLSQGKIEEILLEGGTNLTPEQLSKVVQLSKRQSAEKLQQMQAGVASQPGYRESIIIKAYVEALRKKFGNQTMSKAFSGNATASPMQNPQSAPTDKKDPKVATVAVGRAEKLKPNDSEADILAKMYNFMVKSHTRDMARLAKTTSLKQDEADAEDKRDDEVRALLGVKTKKTGKFNKKAKKKGSGIGLGTVLKVGAVVGGLALMDKAFGKIADTKIDDILPNFKSMADKIIPSAKEGETKQVSSDLNTYLKRVAMAESSGKATAEAETSTAKGLYGFTEGAWKEITKEMGVDWPLSDRTDPEKATKVAAVFTEKNRKYIEKNTGEKASDTDLYMAAFLGQGGFTDFRKVLKQNPNAGSTTAASAAAVKANQAIFFEGHYEPIPNSDKKKFIPDRERSAQEVYNLMANKITRNDARIASGKVPETITGIDKVILPDQKVSVISPKTIDDEKNKENVKAKEQAALSTVVNTVNSVVVVQKNITQKVENAVDDSSEMSKKIKALAR